MREDRVRNCAVLPEKQRQGIRCPAKYNAMVKKRILFLLVMALCLGLVSCGSFRGEIRFGTAGIGGTYYAYGAALAQMMEETNDQYNFSVKTTAGSAANLRLLREEFLDLAIVQSDTLSDAVGGTGVFVTAGPAVGYAAVAGLYTEACQIVVPANSGIERVQDLAGKRVSVGERESGVLQNARDILLSHGISLEMLEPSYLSFADSASAMERGELDAFFCTAGAPTSAVSELAAQTEIRLLSIAPDTLDSLTRLYSGYTPCTIPAGTYPGQDRDVETLGVKAVLVASTDLKEDTVAYLTEFLFANSEKLRYATSVSTDLSLDYAVTDIPLSFHPGAARYYVSQGMDVEIYSGASGQRLTAGQD